MRILLTNDDGIEAEGIYALYLQLKKLGPVSVVAPESERSSVGNAITLAHPLWKKKVYRKGRLFGTSVSGTPADCVKFALAVLKCKPDVVVSGINLGHNDGCSVFYSGTVAGAREGSLMGIPSLAVSLDTFTRPDFAYAARLAAKIVKKIAKEKLPKGTFLNINVPNKKASQIKGIKMTRQGLVPIHGRFRKRKDPGQREYYWMTGVMPVKMKDNRIDSTALLNDYVTVTPIQNDQTDHTFLEQLEHWKV